MVKLNFRMIAGEYGALRSRSENLWRFAICDMRHRIEDIDGLRRSPPIMVPSVNPPIHQQIPPGQSLNITQTQRGSLNKDGSARAVPSTSGFLTGNGGSLNQADPNAHQEFGMDHLRDGMPNPFNVHNGLNDRKQHPQEQISQQEQPSPQEQCCQQKRLSQQESS